MMTTPIASISYHRPVQLPVLQGQLPSPAPLKTPLLDGVIHQVSPVQNEFVQSIALTQRVAAEFGFTGPLFFFNINGGFFNREIPCFRTASGDSFVVKRMQSKKDFYPMLCVEYIKYLKENYFPIPMIFKQNTRGEQVDDYYTQYDQTIYTVERLMPGLDIRYDQASPRAWFHIGQFIDKLLRVSRGFNQDQLGRAEAIAKKSIDDIYQTDFKDLSAENQAYVRSFIQTLTPDDYQDFSVIWEHDFNLGNMKFDQNERPTTIFDFEGIHPDVRLSGIFSSICCSGLPNAKPFNLDANFISKRLIPFIEGFNCEADLTFSRQELVMIPKHFKAIFLWFYRAFKQDRFIDEMKTVDRLFDSPQWRDYIQRY